MSEVFESTHEPYGQLPEGRRPKKDVSPWLLGCGALFLALSALGLMAIVVLVVFWSAARSSLDPTRAGIARPTRVHRGPSVAEQRLADGSLLVLEKVTYGTQHGFDFDMEEPSGGTMSVSRRRVEMPDRPTQKNMTVVWFTHWDSTNRKAKDFSWFLRCAAVDAHGCEIDNIDKGRDAFRNNGSSSTHGGTGPFSRLSGGPHDMIVTYFGLPAFRNEGETFKLRVYGTANEKVAEFEVRDPSPTRGSYPEWEPEPFPITESDGDVSLTLTSLTARSSEVKRSVDGISVTENRVGLSPRFLTQQAGKPTGDWNRRSYRLFDALGNESDTYDCGLCPKESAWELEVKSWRTDTASFDDSEIRSFDKIPVPETQQVHLLNETATWEGTTLQLVAAGGAGSLSYSGLLTGHHGSHRSTGTCWFREGRNHRRIPFTIRVKDNETMVECDVPHLLVRGDVTSQDQRLLLRLKDQDGEELRLYGPRSHTGSLQFWFIDLPEDAQTLDAELIVHQCRTFNFRVAPPEIEPTRTSRASRSPRSPAQRLASAKQAIESGKRALASSPDDAEVLNNLAWAYVTAPDQLRDAKRAVELAEKASASKPESRNYVNTLGAAYYRAGQFDKARSTLGRNAGERTDAMVSFDLYPLAMTYFKLDQADKAKETYEKAFDRHRGPEVSLSSTQWHELYEFRVEAATLFLGEPPEQVFERADKLARKGEWEPAAAEFAKGLDVYPDDHWNSYRSGALHAYLDRPEEFRSDYRRMLDLFGDTEDPFIAERTGKLSLLLPGAAPRDSRASQLCDKAAAMRPENAWFQLASAIAKYRAGKFQDAFDRLQVAEVQAGGQVYCRALIELFRAMSLHHLGQREAAQESLKRAVDELNASDPKAEDGALDYGSSWHDRLMSEVIRREAEALISS